jgi:hypothetical protein
MKVGSDDESRVWLNGKLIYECLNGRAYLADDDVVPDVELKTGLNVVVFKVVNFTGDWAGSVRFTDREGQPLPGLTVSLDPGKELRP